MQGVFLPRPLILFARCSLAALKRGATVPSVKAHEDSHCIISLHVRTQPAAVCVRELPRRHAAGDELSATCGLARVRVAVLASCPPNAILSCFECMSQSAVSHVRLLLVRLPPPALAITLFPCGLRRSREVWTTHLPLLRRIHALEQWKQAVERKRRFTSYLSSRGLPARAATALGTPQFELGAQALHAPDLVAQCMS